MSSKVDNKKGKETSNKKREDSKSKDNKKISKDTKSTKSKESKKDNNVKRALSAYNFYSKLNRSRITKENPEVDNKEIMGLIGKEWRKITEKEKDKYIKMAEDDKERYLDECEEAGISIKTKKKKASSSSNIFI